MTRPSKGISNLLAFKPEKKEPAPIVPHEIYAQIMDDIKDLEKPLSPKQRESILADLKANVSLAACKSRSDLEALRAAQASGELARQEMADVMGQLRRIIR